VRRTGWRYAVLTLLALGLLALVSVRFVDRPHPDQGHGHPPRAVGLRLPDRKANGPQRTAATLTAAPVVEALPVPATVPAAAPRAPGGPALPRRGCRAPPV